MAHVVAHQDMALYKASARCLNALSEIAPQALPLAVHGIDHKDGGKAQWCDVVDDRPFRNVRIARHIDSTLEHLHSTDDESQCQVLLHSSDPSSHGKSGHEKVGVSGYQTPIDESFHALTSAEAHPPILHTATQKKV